MDETFDIKLPPWFAISNSALRGNIMKKIVTFKLKWKWSGVCPIRNMESEESGIKGLPSHYSKCPSQLKY